MSASRFYTRGNAQAWAFGQSPQNANERRRIHGPVRPMESKAGLWVRLRVRARLVLGMGGTRG